MMDHGPLPGQFVHLADVNPQANLGSSCVGPVCGMGLMVCLVHIVEMRLVIVVGAF